MYYKLGYLSISIKTLQTVGPLSKPKCCVRLYESAKPTIEKSCHSREIWRILCGLAMHLHPQQMRNYPHLDSL